MKVEKEDILNRVKSIKKNTMKYMESHKDDIDEKEYKGYFKAIDDIMDYLESLKEPIEE